MKRLLILFTFLTLSAGQLLAQENSAAACNDNFDNDGDGLVDCRDGNCAGFKTTCEVCNNGVDDDGDNFIDCYDKECTIDSNCDGFFLGTLDSCSVPPQTFPPFEMKLKFSSEPRKTNHINRLIVGDVDNDGVPEIVTTYRAADGSGNNTTESKINVLQAPTTGTTLFVDKEIDIFAKNQFVTFEDIAMADIDNNGCAEYFVLTSSSDGNGYKTVAYDCNGNEIWATPISYGLYPGTAGLADFDGDGKIELYFRTQIYDAHTGTFMGENNIDNDNTGVNAGVNSGRGMNTSQSLAIDMDAATGINDPGLELIAGCRIYGVSINRGVMTATITMQKQRTEYATRTGRTTGSSTSIADFDQDGFLDVLAVGSLNAYNANTTIFFWDVKNDELKTFSDPIGGGDYKNGWKNGAGRINIADIDGDTLMNAVYVSGKYLYALKEVSGGTGLSALWRQDVTEETSGYTGCTMFDFNADGKSEIVYRDEDYIYIFTTATDGTVTKSPPVRCASRTSNEYPIVADMNGDGSTEICVTCAIDETVLGKNHSLFDDAEVRVYESANIPWVPARKVWNQHGYFVVNVNDDLTIPRNQQLHHLTYAKNVDCRKDGNLKTTRPMNSFLNQSPFLDNYGCPSFATPNLSWGTFDLDNNIKIEVTAGNCPNREVEINIKFKNLGDIGISGDLPITVYQGNPLAAGAIKLHTFTVPLSNMFPGDSVSIGTGVDPGLIFTGPGSAFTLYVVLNDAGTTVPTPISLPNSGIVECDYGDNVLAVDVTPGPGDIVPLMVARPLQCEGALEVTEIGAVKAYVPIPTTTIRDSVNFEFYWSDGDTSKPLGDEDHIGYLYSQLPADTFSVYAIHKTIGCTTRSEFVVLEPIVRKVEATIVKDKDSDNCKNPNGKLHVNVDTNGDGVPEPTGNFTYVWQDATSGVGDTLSISHTVTSLQGGVEYSVRVTDKATGCEDLERILVNDITQPVVVSTTQTDIDCIGPNTGSASANVAGATNLHFFFWYDGSNVKPTEDFLGDTYSSLAAGSYTVKAVDKNTECFATKTVTIKQKVAPVVSIASKKDHVSCTAAPGVGEATAAVVGNPPGITLTWFAGQNTLGAGIGTGASITGLMPGIYTVEAFDPVTNCSTTAEVTILNKSGVTNLIPVVQNMTKCEPLNGSVTVTPLAGLPTDYTYKWYTGPVVKAVNIISGQVGNALTDIGAGTYTVIAKHIGTGCNTNDTSAQVLNLTPTISINIDPSTITYPSECDSDEGKIKATISITQASDLTVEWYKDPSFPPIDRGDLEESHNFSNVTSVLDSLGDPATGNGLTFGYYTILVRNENDGCTAVKPYFLRSTAMDSVTIAATASTNCNPFNGTVTAGLLINSENTGNGITKDDYTIKLFNLDGTPAAPDILGASNPDNNFVFTGLDSGSYFLRGVSSAPGNPLGLCELFSDIIRVDFTPDVDPKISLTATPNESCIGAPGGPNGSITATVVTNPSGTGPNNFTYSFYAGVEADGPVTFIDDDPNNAATTSSQTGLASGFYTVTMTAHTNGCSTEDFVFVPEDMATVMPDVDTLSRTNCSPLMPDGQITVTSIIEIKGNGPSAPIPFNALNYTINWFDSLQAPLADATIPPANVLESLANNEYYVEVIDNTTNCKSSKVFVQIEDRRRYPIINLVDFLAPTKCLSIADGDVPAELVDLYDPTTGQYSGYLAVGIGTPPADGPYTITWTGPAVTDPTEDTLKTLTPGTYRIRLENAKRCAKEDEYVLPQEIFPITIEATSSPVTHCINPDGAIGAHVRSGINTHYDFDWVSPTISFLDDNIVTTAPEETYELTVTDKRDATCFVTQTVIVDEIKEIVNLVAMAMNPVTVCTLDSAKQDGMASASVDGNFIDYNYSWYEGSRVIPPNPTDTIPQGHGPMIGTLAVNTYTVVARNVFTGCFAKQEVTISSEPMGAPDPTIEILSNVTICPPYDTHGTPNGILPNGALAASVGGNTIDYIFNWYVGNAVKVVPDSADYPAIHFLPTGEYSVIAIDRETLCPSNLKTAPIIFEPTLPEFTMEATPTLCGEATGIIYLTVKNDIGISNISWRFNGTDLGPLENGPVLDNAEKGLYEAIVTTQNNCKDSLEIVVNAEINPFNGISRNGDDVNSYFHIDCIGDFPMNIVKVYNRAGTLVFEGKNYDNSETLFDGVSNKGISPMGNNLPDGTYFYVIDKHDGSKPLAGYLEIVN